MGLILPKVDSPGPRVNVCMGSVRCRWYLQPPAPAQEGSRKGGFSQKPRAKLQAGARAAWAPEWWCARPAQSPAVSKQVHLMRGRASAATEDVLTDTPLWTHVAKDALPRAFVMFAQKKSRARKSRIRFLKML